MVCASESAILLGNICIAAHSMAQFLSEILPDSGGPTLYDVLRAVPCLWSLLGRQSSLSLRTVSKETRGLHDAACLSLHVHLGLAASFQKAQLVGRSAVLDALLGIKKRGCQPIKVTINADCEATLCAVLQEVAFNAFRIAIYGSARLSDRLGATLVTFVPQLQHLVLDLSEASSAKGADQVLAAIGHRLRVLELRIRFHGSLPACSLEECTALEDLRLTLDMHALAPLGPLRMRGDNAPPAIDAIASLGTHLRSLELVGSSLPRLLDPPHRLAGLSELTALTRLRVDMPPGFLTPQLAEVVTPAPDGFAADASSSPLTATGAQQTAELRWRAMPLTASLDSLVEVHLGRSYELTMCDMRVLARALQLTTLACRNIVLPPTPTHDGGGSMLGGPGPRQMPPPPAVPFPPRLRELQVRRLPCAPVLAALDSLPPPGLQVLKCRAFEKAIAAVTAAAVAAAAAATVVDQFAPASTFSYASALPFVSGALSNLGPSDPGCYSPLVAGGLREKQPPDDLGAQCTARLTEADLAGPDLGVDILESNSGFVDVAAGLEAATHVREAVADWGLMQGGGEALRSGLPAAIEPTETVTTAARGAEVRNAAASKKTPRESGEWLRLALVGSFCTADSIDAGPWVAEVALAAFRLLSRLLFTYPPPWPLPSPLCAIAAAPPAPRPAALPALSIRPFERGSGKGGGSGTTASATTILRGPYAGSWLAALAPLGSAGLSTLQLRHFELETGDLQLLQVAIPELRSCELRDCFAAEEDVRQLQSWLQRPLGGEALRHDPRGLL